jgi:hypothetical protein
MRITSGGNVLIGTSTDAGQKLQVQGTLRATGTITQFATTGYYVDMTYIGNTYNLGSGETTDNIDFKIAGGGTFTSGGSFRWFTQAGGSTPLERLKITSAGACNHTVSSNSVFNILNLYNSSGTSSGNRINFQNYFGDLGGIVVSQRDNGSGADDGQMLFEVASNASNQTILGLRNDGLVYFNTLSSAPYNYNVTYNPRTAGLGQGGDFGYITSIRESKGNIESITNIDFINQLNPVSFNYRKKDTNNKEFIDELYEDVYYGFIADEVETIDKNLVFYDDLEGGGKKLSGVHYNSMIAILTKAVQELNTKLDAANVEIEALKAK